MSRVVKFLLSFDMLTHKTKCLKICFDQYSFRNWSVKKGPGRCLQQTNKLNRTIEG